MVDTKPNTIFPENCQKYRAIKKDPNSIFREKRFTKFDDNLDVAYFEDLKTDSRYLD